MRLVVDTNVLVSLTIRPTAEFDRLVDYIDANAVLLYSHETLSELVDVLHRSKLSKYIDRIDIVRLLKWYLDKGEYVRIGHPNSVAIDSSDDYFLAVAERGKADCLVSGDRHLLAIGSHGNTVILSPADFCKIL
jgi:putative PIN family toxin of toxin-antitoxin system